MILYLYYILKKDINIQIKKCKCNKLKYVVIVKNNTNLEKVYYRNYFILTSFYY